MEIHLSSNTPILALVTAPMDDGYATPFLSYRVVVEVAIKRTLNCVGLSPSRITFENKGKSNRGPIKITLCKQQVAEQMGKNGQRKYNQTDVISLAAAHRRSHSALLVR